MNPHDEIQTPGCDRGIPLQRSGDRPLASMGSEKTKKAQNCESVNTKIESPALKMLKNPTWMVHQYRVDFTPDVDVMYLRRKYLAQHSNLFNGYLFDGTMLFCAKQVVSPKRSGAIELICKGPGTEKSIKITVRHVGVIKVCNDQQMQLMKFVFQRAIDAFHLHLHSHSKIDLHSWKTLVRPQCRACVRHPAHDVFMCVDIPRNIVMRHETLYGMMDKYARDMWDWQQAFKRDVIGIFVVAEYKNKTYRVDDVDFGSNPSSKFRTQDGEIAFIEYYKKRHDIKIQVEKQPLLVSTLTEQNRRGETNEFVKLMVVIPAPNEKQYVCIKKFCFTDRPIPSQVVTLKKIVPRGDNGGDDLMSIATNVVIQMIAKLHGVPWMVELPISGLMMVGFDVCHSEKENKSFGALVATMDMKSSIRFYSAVTQHTRGQELSNALAVNMTCALKIYRQEHGTFPERIIFYRDGVGHGQLHQVFNTEVKFLANKLDEIYRFAGVTTGCRLAFIVVSKHINTCYLNKRCTTPPNTIRDDVVALPKQHDFYIVSQAFTESTVSPTNYNVLYNTTGFELDKLQSLTYKMAHMYYKEEGTARVPVVCQYAHKLAIFVAEGILRCPSNAFENQSCFL